MKRFNFKVFFIDIFKNKLTVFMCVLVSTVLWFLIIIFNSDSYSLTTIQDVPVDLNLSNTQAEQLGLFIVDISPVIASVTVKGPRHKIAFLNKDDIFLAPESYNNIITQGVYKLPINASLKKMQEGVSVDKLSTDSIIIKVDVLENKLFNLVSEDIEVKVEPGYMKDELVCQPSSLYVSGPKQSMDNLDVIKLYADVNGSTLNATKTFDANLKFISKDGAEMDKSLFRYSNMKCSVTVPIYKVKQLPFKIGFSNAPSCLNKELLNTNIDPPFIDIAGPDEIIGQTNEINLGFVDMAELTEEKNSFSFNVNLPSGFKNLTQATSALVSFNKDRLASKFFNIKGIQLINVPQGYEVSVHSKIIKDVKIVGIKEYLEKLSDTDLISTIDFSNIKFEEGVKQNVPVNIGIINKDGVWPSGKYKCFITVNKK